MARAGVTKRRDLRTGRSIWQGTAARPMTAAPLSRDTRVDALIVGAGISGAMMAEQLTDMGLEVLVVDRRKPLSGSTTASTALLQYELDQSVGALSGLIGKERAQRAWRRSFLALQALYSRTRALGIRADLAERDALLIEGDTLDEDGLAAEAALRSAMGFHVDFLPRKEVKARYGLSKRAAILGFDNLAANPVKLARGFLATALARKARLCSNTEITDVEASRDEVLARTATGVVIRAQHLIFCTGYETPRMVPAKGHSIISTWAFATVPQTQTPWPEQPFLWEASDPYLYLRVGPGNRVICGGEDEDFADEDRRDALMEGKIATLQKKLKALMPWLDVAPEYRWCGNFGASKTGMPSIGRVPGLPHCYAVLGYGGNGITFSMMAAQMIRTMLSGQTDPDSDLFSFTRTF